MTDKKPHNLKSDHSRNVYLMSAGNFSLDSEWELFLGSPR